MDIESIEELLDGDEVYSSTPTLRRTVKTLFPKIDIDEVERVMRKKRYLKATETFNDIERINPKYATWIKEDPEGFWEWIKQECQRQE